MTTRKPAALALIFVFALALPVLAQEEELVTDRPDQTESAVTVAEGKVQVEAGWTFTRDEGEGVAVETHEAPSTLVRVGLAPRWELRLGWGGRVDASVDGPGVSFDADGAADAEVGGKVRLWGERGGRPEAAVLFGTSVPVGDDAFTSDRFDPAVRLSLAHTLLRGWSLGYNLGAEWASEPAGGGRTTRSRFLYTAAAGRGLGERGGVFVELFGDLGGSAGGPPSHSLDGGVTWLLRPNLQLDAAAGVGLSDGAPDWFAGVGVSVRLPR